LRSRHRQAARQKDQQVQKHEDQLEYLEPVRGLRQKKCGEYVHGGRSREAEASSISNGATVIIPSPSEANHCCQVVNIGVVVL
jgi:hypothetical protein